MRGVGYLSAAAILAASLGGAHAGGFSRGTADTDILYEDGNFNLRAGAVIVVPTQKFTKAVNPALVGTNYLDTYVIPSAAVKFRISDSLSCAATYTDVQGAASSYDAAYGPAPGSPLGFGKRGEKFTVAEFGATCAVFFDVGPGRLSVLGGGFVEQFDYSFNFVSPGGANTIALDSNARGWRAGLGYEVPDIALRAQLLYRSGTRHNATGTLNTIVPASASGELPQSLELKVQTGVAPGWLAFGSVKWMDWSVNQTLQVTAGGAPLPPNQYFWRDGWTVTGGVGHAFNEKVSGLVSLQWDRGVSTGYDLRTDKWLLAAGLGLKDDLGGELRLGAAVSFLSAADITKGTDAGHSVGAGWAGIVSANYKVKW